MLTHISFKYVSLHKSLGATIINSVFINRCHIFIYTYIYRVITLTKKYDHITPVLKELHWLPVRKRIEFKILLLAYKCLHGTAPSYLRELLKEYVPPRTLRSTSKNLLCEPRNNMKTYGDRSFSACAPKLWNQLPDNIRAAGSVAIFKRQLKTHLFKDV